MRIGRYSSLSITILKLKNVLIPRIICWSFDLKELGDEIAEIISAQYNVYQNTCGGDIHHLYRKELVNRENLLNSVRN